MSSRQKRKANRLNAQKSTGPKTPEGKARSSQNAIKHGVYAEGVVLRTEDVARYHAVRCEIAMMVGGDTPLDYQVINRMAAAQWKLDRLTIFETSVYDKAIEAAGGDLANAFSAMSNELEKISRLQGRLTREISTCFVLMKFAQESEGRTPGTSSTTAYSADDYKRKEAHDEKVSRELEAIIQEAKEKARQEAELEAERSAEKEKEQLAHGQPSSDAEKDAEKKAETTSGETNPCDDPAWWAKMEAEYGDITLLRQLDQVARLYPEQPKLENE